jgi:hypothetical protein
MRVIYTKRWSGNFKGRKQVEDLDVDEKIMILQSLITMADLICKYYVGVFHYLRCI